MLLHIRSLAAYTIDMLESSFWKRQGNLQLNGVGWCGVAVLCLARIGHAAFVMEHIKRQKAQLAFSLFTLANLGNPPISRTILSRVRSLRGRPRKPARPRMGTLAIGLPIAGSSGTPSVRIESTSRFWRFLAKLFNRIVQASIDG